MSAVTMPNIPLIDLCSMGCRLWEFLAVHREAAKE